MIALTVAIELCDSPPQDKFFFVGVYDNAGDIEKAKAVVKAQYRHTRLWWKEETTELNLTSIPRL